MQILRVLGLFGLLLGSAQCFAVVQLPCPNRNNPGVPNNPPCQSGFPAVLVELGQDNGGASSPTIADLDGDGLPEIIFGTDGGKVVAMHGDGSLYWSSSTGSVPVQSKPAVGDIDGDGQMEVVVGAGSAVMDGGGVYVFRSNGQLKCSFTDLNPAIPRGVFSSPAIGRLDSATPGRMQIVFGSFDFRLRAIRDDCSVWWELGVPEYVVDTIWSSPSIVDLDRNGTLDVVIGADSNLHALPGITLPDGGMIRALQGNGSSDLPGFPILLDEVVYSSPAIGDIVGNGQWSIVAGSGRCWDIPGCGSAPHPVTKAAYGWNKSGGNLGGWPVTLAAQSARTASPALARFSGINGLVTVLNTMRNDDLTGVVNVLGPNGAMLPGWPKQPDIPATCTPGDVVHYGTQASPVVANLVGDAEPEIILPSGNEFVIWDRYGNQLTTRNGCPAEPDKLSLSNGDGSFFNSAAIADLDGDGKLELVGVGRYSSLSGSPGVHAAVYAWTFAGSVASPKNMDWPMFRHDAQNHGVFIADRIFSSSFDP